MQPEIEAKFLNVDFNNVRKLLIKNGAKCTMPMRMMKRDAIVFQTVDFKLAQVHGLEWG
jgi:hypothetical protein